MCWQNREDPHPPDRQPEVHPGGGSYLCRPLSMKHTHPQLLSPSSGSISVHTAASMVPATGEWVLTGAQRWVPAGSRLQVRELVVNKGRGEDSNRPPHFPALRGRKARLGFYGIHFPSAAFQPAG